MSDSRTVEAAKAFHLDAERQCDAAFAALMAAIREGRRGEELTELRRAHSRAGTYARAALDFYLKALENP